MVCMDLINSVEKIDQKYLVDSLQELARVPTDVPMGLDTFIEPDDPKLVYYVQEVLRPKIESLQVSSVVDIPRNQLLLEIGDGDSSRSLLVMVYTPTQHHNLMANPFSGAIADGSKWGFNEPCLFGQGVGQNKSHQAIMLSVLKWIKDYDVKLAGKLLFAVNNEGRSSHACSNALLGAINGRPDFGILMTRTGKAISLGNRGRVDVNVEIKGKSSHSSVPHMGHSAIEGANRVLDLLKNVPLGDSDPLLGRRHVIPYQLSFEPLAPHTLPSLARLRVDRRLLPGDQPEEAANDIRESIGELDNYQVTVTTGEYMLPALCDPYHLGVEYLMQSHRQIMGVEPDTFYGQGTFDAGGPAALGVPTVMYGVGGGDWPLGDDFVPISHLVEVAKVMAHTIVSMLG